MSGWHKLSASLLLVLVPAVSHATTYNFYFNNTEQGNNSTASPSLSVIDDGKNPPQVIKNAETPALAQAEAPAAETEPPASEFIHKKLSLTAEIVDLSNESAGITFSGNKRDYLGFQVGFNYSPNSIVSLGAFLGGVSRSRDNRSSRSQSSQSEKSSSGNGQTYQSSDSSSSSSSESESSKDFQPTYGLVATIYPFRFSFKKNYDVLTFGLNLGLMRSWSNSYSGPSGPYGLSVGSEEKSGMFGFAGLRINLFIEQAWGFTLASNGTFGGGSSQMETLSLGGIFRF